MAFAGEPADEEKDLFFAVGKQCVDCQFVAFESESADNAATGENPVVVACRTADIIVGPVGIVAADSLNGEITPKMALAVGQANATRILIPMNRCDILVAGVKNASVNTLIDDAVDKIGEML